MNSWTIDKYIAVYSRPERPGNQVIDSIEGPYTNGPIRVVPAAEYESLKEAHITLSNLVRCHADIALVATLEKTEAERDEARERVVELGKTINSVLKQLHDLTPNEDPTDD